MKGILNTIEAIQLSIQTVSNYFRNVLLGTRTKYQIGDIETNHDMVSLLSLKPVNGNNTR